MRLGDHVAVHQVLLRFPPKSVFQVLTDPTVIEEFTNWRVQGPDRFDVGARWTERRFLRKRTWAVTAYGRRGLTFTMEGEGVTVAFAAKKGGPQSCNVQMQVDGPPRAVARFEKTDGDRLERLRDWLEGDD